MSERKSGAQDTHVGRDCMLLYQQEGDEQHRKAAERIHWLEQEVERLREDISDMVNERNEEVLALLALRVEYPKLQRTASELRVEVERLRSKLNTQEIAEGRAADLEYEPTDAEARLTRLVERLEQIPRHVISPSEFRRIGDGCVVRADALDKAIAETQQGRPAEENGDG